MITLTTTTLGSMTLADAISDTWRAIRLQHRELPPVTLSVVPGRGSADGSVDWDQDSPVLLVGTRTVAEGPEAILGWLVHQAAHGLLQARGEGSGSRYHSPAYRKAAEALGLTVDYSNNSWGWSSTSIGDDLRTAYQRELAELDSALAGWAPPAAQDRNGIPARCQHAGDCPSRVQAIRVRTHDAAEALEAVPVICSFCKAPFVPVGGPDAATEILKQAGGG